MNKTKIHFVGVKGVGMAGLALIAYQGGAQVSGSDVAENFITHPLLKAAGLEPLQLDKANITKIQPTLVVYTAAHGGRTNPEVVQAESLGVKTMSYARAVEYFFRGQKIIVVAGSHGKTTTAGMLALILRIAGLDPSWLVGTSEINGLGLAAHLGQGKLAVVEGDEYVADPSDPSSRPKFLYLTVRGAIITSTDWDHPDVFPTAQVYAKAFKKLLQRVPPSGIIVANGTDAWLRRFGKGASAKIKWVLPGRPWAGLKLKVAGRHNLFDASLAAAMAHELGVKQVTIKLALTEFGGGKRRLERVAEVKGIRVYDDYAHHPVEITATLQALRELCPKGQLWVIFQSHTYSRSRTLAADFAQSLKSVEHLAIAPIFASARELKGEYTDADFLAAIKKVNPRMVAVANAAQAAQFIQPARPGDLVALFGAGNLNNWLPELVQSLRRN